MTKGILVLIHFQVLQVWQSYRDLLQEKIFTTLENGLMCPRKHGGRFARMNDAVCSLPAFNYKLPHLQRLGHEKQNAEPKSTEERRSRELQRLSKIPNENGPSFLLSPCCNRCLASTNNSTINCKYCDLIAFRWSNVAMPKHANKGKNLQYT